MGQLQKEVATRCESPIVSREKSERKRNLNRLAKDFKKRPGEISVSA
jgi:hypothetical protein